MFLKTLAKHLIENRLPEAVQAVDGALAQAAQTVRLIEDRRNALLLFEWRKGYFNAFYNRFGHLLEGRTVAKTLQPLAIRTEPPI